MSVVLTNSWLWFLTARGNDFVDPELNTGIRHRTHESAEITAARRILHLSDTRTDFHVLGAFHAALYCARFITAEQAPLTNLNRFSRPSLRPTAVTGATSVPPTSGRWPVLRNLPSAIPAPTLFTVTRVGDLAAVSDDAGGGFSAPFRTAGDLVIIDAMQGVGIDSGFVVDGGWTDGASFSVFCEPSRYPFASVASAIRADPELLTFTLQHVAAAALDTPHPVAVVGTLAAAIINAQAKLCSGLSMDITAESGDTFTYDEGRLCGSGCEIPLTGEPDCYVAQT